MHCDSIEKNKNSCDDYCHNDFEKHFFHFRTSFFDTLEVKSTIFPSVSTKTK